MVYRCDNELIAFSGFFKTFKDPIELTFYSASAPGNTQHRNIGEAMVYGGEIELRQNFDFIAEQLKKFDININFSYIQSIQEMDKSPNGEYESKLANLRDGETMKDTRTLQGQSPFLLNIGLGYKNADKGWGFQFGL
jgi:outer membrane receptor protein involved in Fe transport